MQRERSQAAQTARIRVPMRSTGTEQPVIVTKVLQWDWSEGAALFSRGHGSTDAIWQREEPVDEAKPFDIPKREVWEAFKKVKVNQGAAGVDGQSIADFEADLSNNLYKLWNRLSRELLSAAGAAGGYSEGRWRYARVGHPDGR